MKKTFQEILVVETQTADFHTDITVIHYESGYDAYCTIPNPHERTPGAGTPSSEKIKSYPSIFYAMSHEWRLLVPPTFSNDTQTFFWWLSRIVEIERP